MVETKLICDKCRSQIMSDRHLWISESGSLRERLPSLDLCADCQMKFLAWLDAEPTANERT